MLLKETFYLFLITNFALIRGKKALVLKHHLPNVNMMQVPVPEAKGKLMYESCPSFLNFF